MKDVGKTQHASESAEKLESWLSSKITRVAELAQTADGRKHLRVKIPMILCRLLIVAIIGYAAGLLALIVFMKWVGERNVTTAFFLYLPPAIWLLPVPVLVFFTLLITRPYPFPAE